VLVRSVGKVTGGGYEHKERDWRRGGLGRYAARACECITISSRSFNTVNCYEFVVHPFVLIIFSHIFSSFFSFSPCLPPLITHVSLCISEFHLWGISSIYTCWVCCTCCLFSSPFLFTVSRGNTHQQMLFIAHRKQTFVVNNRSQLHRTAQPHLC
jgi:hypothetical protein